MRDKSDKAEKDTRAQLVAAITAAETRAVEAEAKAAAAIAAAEAREQEHKRRMVAAEKVGQRLWLALAELDVVDGKSTPPQVAEAAAKARAIRDRDVRKGAFGILELT